MEPVNWQQLVIYLLGLAALAGMVWTMLHRLQEDVREIKRQMADLPVMREKIGALERRADASGAWRDEHERLHMGMLKEQNS